MTTIADLMTRDPVAVRPRETVQRAAQLMDELNVGCLPVCEDWQVRGIVTDRDITVRATAAGLDPKSTEVASVMSEGVRCCSQRQSAAEVLRQMAAVQIRRLPVIDDAGRLVGIVSLGDLAARQPAGVEEALRLISTPSAPDRVAA
jgi:CBS domain-containing protein